MSSLRTIRITLFAIAASIFTHLLFGGEQRVAISVSCIEVNTSNDKEIRIVEHLASSSDIDTVIFNDIDSKAISSLTVPNAKCFLFYSTHLTDDDVSKMLIRSHLLSKKGIARIAFECSDSLQGNFITSSSNCLSDLDTIAIFGGNHGCKMTPDQFAVLATSGKVKKLFLCESFNSFNPLHAKAIGDMKNLEELDLPVLLSDYEGHDEQQQETTYLKCLDIVFSKTPRIKSFNGVPISAAKLADRQGILPFRESDAVLFESENDIVALSSFPKLDKVVLNAAGTTPNVVFMALSRHKELQGLSISHLDLRKIPSNLWDRLSCLESLALSEVSLSDMTNIGFRRLKRLKRLEISASDPFDGKILSETIGSLDNLEYLYISSQGDQNSAPLFGFDIKDLSGSSNLKSLTLVDITHSDQDKKSTVSTEWSNTIKSLNIRDVHISFLK